MGRKFFQILGSIAEFEHALMSERTIDGLAAARARGRTGGQKPKLIPRQAKIAQQMYEETGPDGRRVHTVDQIAAEFGVTRPTAHRAAPGPVGGTAGHRELPCAESHALSAPVAITDVRSRWSRCVRDGLSSSPAPAAWAPKAGSECGGGQLPRNTVAEGSDKTRDPDRGNVVTRPGSAR
ncbi:recombinase family protein [Micromonosporaceae bacterium Da 78-11]